MTINDQRSRRTAAHTAAATPSYEPASVHLSDGLPSRPRRYGQWAAAVTFVLVTAVAAAWLYQSKGDSVEVLVARADIAPGSLISSTDLGTISVSGAADAVSVTDADSIIGKRTTVGLVAGQVLVSGMFTDEPVPGVGEGLASLAMPDGRIPAGLSEGDSVIVLSVPGQGTAPHVEDLDDPPVLTDSASVFAIQDSSDGTTAVTLLLDEAEAQRVAAYGAVGQATLVESSIVKAER